jgi:hypothetical protein
MSAVEELKKVLERGEFSAELFPTYLKAAEELFETNEELREAIDDIGDFAINFNITDANVSAHIESKTKLSISGGKGGVDSPDISMRLTEKAARDFLTGKEIYTSTWVSGAMSGDIMMRSEGLIKKATDMMAGKGLMGMMSMVTGGMGGMGDMMKPLEMFSILDMADAELGGIKSERGEKSIIDYNPLPISS